MEERKYDNAIDKYWVEHQCWKYAAGFIAGMLFIALMILSLKY